MHITHAIILAGGFGTRLQSVVSDLPKPMAPINGKPFLEYQIRFLKHYGITHVTLSVGYLHQKISDYFKSNVNGIEITYCIEDTPLGTGGGIRKAIEQCKEEVVLVLNGDSFFDINLKQFQDSHFKSNANFSLAIRKIENASRYGTITLDSENHITSFAEKTDSQNPGLINAGVYILNKNQYLTNTAKESNFSIEKDFFEKQLNQLVIKGFELSGYFIDIGIPSDYQKAQHDFKEFKY